MTTRRKVKVKEANRAKPSSCPVFNEIKKSSPTAVPTTGGIVGVTEISANGRHELVRPTLRWNELVGLTLNMDLEPVELGADHPAHNASERSEVVLRPLPDTGVTT